MERNGRDENESSSSQQNTLWKQFQAKAKPLLSPKLGSRDADSKKERCGWMFKKMTRKENVVLDRVISSSQPDLLFPSQAEAKEAQLCNKHTGTCSGVSREKMSPSRLQPTVAQLVQSHHKSSSLGSACLERLAEPPERSSGVKNGDEAATAAAAAAEEEEAAGGAQLESRDEESVSSESVKHAARLRA